MFLKRLFLVIIFFFICNAVFPATFIVTSNADSGPGTLRQALLDAAANGTLITDNIQFNLPGNTQAAITITLLSQLPDVTANVIIDGATQPSAALGVSNAKVIITVATPAANFNAFNVSNLVGPTDVVQFYGLDIKGFSPASSGFGSAIITGANCNLVIGAPGKGNVICGNWYAIGGFLQNAVIQSNFIGIDIDGETAVPNWSVLYSAADYNNLLIGGNTAGDGNVIEGGNTNGIDFGTGTGNGISKTTTIQGNFFGTDYKGTTSITSANNPFILINDPNSTLTVSGNVFNPSQTAIAAFNNAGIIVTGNFFGIDNTHTISLGSGNQAIEENNGINATIGGTTPAAQNIFTGYFNPIVAIGNCTTNVIQNEFYCNTNVQLNDPSGTNFVRITSLLANSVSGDAPPGATVQLYYYKTQCTTCNPNLWFATVTANAAGHWQYNGSIILNVMASSTVNNNTYGFQPYIMSQSEVTITNYDCHHAGSIVLNENRVGNFQFIWTDSNGKTVATTQNLTNAAPGTYSLEINEGGTCPVENGQFTITNLLPQVFASTAQLNCANATASFTTYPILAPGFTVAKYYWLDAAGKLLSNTATVNNLAAGNYTLYITDSNGCNSDTVICQVLPPLATPVINTGNAVINDATCNLSNGSITGITITNQGNANYGWDTASGSIFESGQLNLTNAPAGQYYFYVEYDFNCPPVISQVFTVNEKNVITIDPSAVSITSSTCSNNNGAISGIVTNGATTYQWFNAANAPVGSSLDLVNVPSGNYYLVASNATCSQQTAVYTINNIPPFDNYPSNVVIIPASCNQNDGGIIITFSDDPDSSPVSYRWATLTGTRLGSDGPLQNQPFGTYQLYVTDLNGCESLYNTYNIGSTPSIQIASGSVQITNDQCGHGVGGIQNVSITGGVPPYTYSWLNSSQQVVGDSLNISGIVAGIYTLQVKDATTCDISTQDYTVPDQSEFVAPPTADNLEVCSPGDVLVIVKNVQAGDGYRLYSTATSTPALDDETSGIFKVSATGSGSVYVTQYSGTCESARFQVNITVGLSSLNIPNTFTPNGDGVNDVWTIKGIENYPNALVQIFNRYGQRVFESHGYATPFDGNTGGTPLPVGVYYYIINVNTACSLLSGSLTLLR